MLHHPPKCQRSVSIGMKEPRDVIKCSMFKLQTTLLFNHVFLKSLQRFAFSREDVLARLVLGSLYYPT